MPATARKAETEAIAVSPDRTGTVVHLARRATPKIDLKRAGADVLRNILPPLVVTLVLLAIWQIACSQPGATLPSPSQVWSDSYDLIAYPFFEYGSQDIGLAWRVLTSLERVAIGFGLAAIVGVFLGAVVGQSIWAMRGLDPIFQILRTVPPLAWLPLSLAALDRKSVV